MKQIRKILRIKKIYLLKQMNKLKLTNPYQFLANLKNNKINKMRIYQQVQHKNQINNPKSNLNLTQKLKISNN